MCKSADSIARESAFRIFAGCPNLVMDLQTDAVLRVLQEGLQDRQSIEVCLFLPLTPAGPFNFSFHVRHAALRASVSYLTSCDQHQVAQSLSLMYPMLDTLPSLSHAHLPRFLITLTPLTSSHPQLFAPHLHVLLSFLPALIIPSADLGPMPTVARPFPGTQSFTFPPTPNGGPPDDDELDEEAEEVRKAALEFMISLSEAKPAMVRRVDGWVSAVCGCLGGMGELRDDELSTWLDADICSFFANLLPLFLL
jgi:hypothetical protein